MRHEYVFQDGRLFPHRRVRDNLLYGWALLSGPSFLLMDEPPASLDMAGREDIMQVIERLRDELALPLFM